MSAELAIIGTHSNKKWRLSATLAAIYPIWEGNYHIMSQQVRKNQYDPVKELDPAKRAKAIREAIAKGKVKRCDIVDETLALIDEIVTQETKQAS
jgi:hypothetical protein